MDVLRNFQEEIAEHIEFHAKHEEDMPPYVKELLLQRIEFLREVTEDLNNG